MLRPLLVHFYPFAERVFEAVPFHKSTDCGASRFGNAYTGMNDIPSVHNITDASKMSLIVCLNAGRKRSTGSVNLVILPMKFTSTFQTRHHEL